MANQYLLDPRQLLFFEYYLDPKSETFSNILRSALKAGYEQSYAENISGQMPDWYKDKLGDINLLAKAERNLDRFLDMEDKPQIQADITKFVAERVGKKKYSQRNENINVDIPLPILVEFLDGKKDNTNT